MRLKFATRLLRFADGSPDCYGPTLYNESVTTKGHVEAVARRYRVEPLP